MMVPWYISARAVREWAALRGVHDLPDAGPAWDRYERELLEISAETAARRSPKRTAGGLLCYRIRRPVDAQLMVSDSARPEGELPQLVSVVRGYGGRR